MLLIVPWIQESYSDQCQLFCWCKFQGTSGDRARLERGIRCWCTVYTIVTEISRLPPNCPLIGSNFAPLSPELPLPQPTDVPVGVWDLLVSVQSLQLFVPPAPKCNFHATVKGLTVLTQI